MKNFTIKTFGMLSEKLPASEFEFPYYENSEALLNALKGKYPVLKSLDFTIAIDKQINQGQVDLKGNEEIALLPPFSGG
jgi:molybdopterin converting factor small subunit